MADHLFNYDPATGALTWKVNRSWRKAGDTVGEVSRYGYVSVSYVESGRRVRVQGHRLAWRLYYGEWPPSGMQIDHINGDRGDNRIANLRLATAQQNRMNEASRTGLPKGVRLWKKGNYARWQARIKKDRKSKHLGYFDTIEDAHAAYMRAAHDLFGAFARGT